MHSARAQLATARTTPGVDDYLRAWSDWWLALAAAPEQQLALAQWPRSPPRSTTGALRSQAAQRARPTACGCARHDDGPICRRRAWIHWPFNVYAHGHAQLQEVELAGAGARRRRWPPDNAQRLEFLRRLALDATLAGALPADQSGIARADRAPKAAPTCCAARSIGSRTRHACSAAARARHREIPRRRAGRGHAGQGRHAQRAHGADPVQPARRDRARRADADHAGVDHEVLRARPLAAQFAGQVPRRPAATRCS